MALPLEETGDTLCFLKRYIPEQRTYIKIFTVLNFCEKRFLCEK